MLLETQNVSSGYFGANILIDISIQIKKGEFVSIIGSNGAGKTTFLRTISGLIKPNKGMIFFDNDRIDDKESFQISSKYKIAHIPEGRYLFPRMTVLQNLELGAYNTKDKKEIREMKEKIFELFPRIYERLSQLAGTLSGGEQQMLAISRGLMLNPKLLMLDEPSLGVQPNIVSKIYETLKLINKQGLTVLLVEQNVKEALEMSSRAYIIQTGRIILEGKGKELFCSEVVQKAYLGI